MKFLVSPDGDILIKTRNRCIDPKFIENDTVTRLSEIDGAYKQLILCKRSGKTEMRVKLA